MTPPFSPASIVNTMAPSPEFQGITYVHGKEMKPAADMLKWTNSCASFPGLKYSHFLSQNSIDDACSLRRIFSTSFGVSESASSHIFSHSHFSNRTISGSTSPERPLHPFLPLSGSPHSERPQRHHPRVPISTRYYVASPATKSTSDVITRASSDSNRQFALAQQLPLLLFLLLHFLKVESAFSVYSPSHSSIDG